MSELAERLKALIDQVDEAVTRAQGLYENIAEGLSELDSIRRFFNNRQSEQEGDDEEDQLPGPAPEG